MKAAFTLEGKVAVVTGSGQGLGQGMALGLAEAGADIVGVNYGPTAETKEKVEALGRKYTELVADLSKEEEVYRVVKEALQSVDKVDILVNNAGIIRRTEVENFSDKDWHDVIDVNQHAVFKLCREFGKHMLENGSGRIINVASMLSYQGGLRVPSYTASKHAVAGLTKSFANEWAGRGVNVNAIAPGYFATANTAPLRADEDRSASILSRIPKGDWGTPDDLKGPVVFLASDASSYVTGHILCVDGGWMSS
ncbi:2-dehydro-3-deoxy-D-gluconate 5-dehydrogenase KduD [Evansella sp. AB-P1]|uniref:2-dehydro-3-deoxy-D-gluconate 5-dehydrogenase KduD n=1 Tax=Evansella sp. AB-P1 TaxID=3037653 RepID=UPI00241D0F96|nr:2-dehydro-3-deoxy-D-gluconate 5-dehydrogenase KduD [Evansella sp. AB-P1]MDG5787874.1 2-dehydro-3-deoxy-D-gluconate 5-dehydrogenase KduD [Evansella sp. AB-P1]